MEYILPVLFLVVTVGVLIFLTADAFDNYQKLLENKKKSEGKFTKKSWELFKSSIAKNLDYKRIFLPKIKKEEKIHHKELMKVLLGLDDEKLDELLKLYKQQFGDGAARYARRTYRKWEKGEVKPIKQTFERFLVHLPLVMDFDLKCEVLRHLMEAYCAKDSYNLAVFTDDWEETLEPLVQKLIDKPYNASLPKQIEDRLIWLAHDDMQAAESILKKSQVEEGKIAVSMLREEFKNIEHLLANAKGRRKVTHKLKFPYGTINLKIKRR